MKAIKVNDIASYLLKDCQETGILTPVLEAHAVAIDGAIRIRAILADDRELVQICPLSTMTTVTPAVLRAAERVVMGSSAQVVKAMKEVNAQLTA